jgi:maltose/moltooligosaccharide transporter
MSIIDSQTTTAIKKPHLTFWQIWNMSFGFLGIQFGFAIQNANTSRIFQKLGAAEADLPVLWLAAPMTGMLVQPLIGYFSDRTWHPTFGRRRPYFTIGAILASLALFIMPNSPSLWIAAGMLWIMDASINISMEPFRAFVGDMLASQQRTAGFAMQSFFIGTGAVIGSFLPWFFTNVFDFDNQAVGLEIPPNVIASYYTGGVVFFAAVMWTVFSTKEYPPEILRKHDDVSVPAGHVDSIKDDNSKYFIRGIILSIVTVALALWFYYASVEKELYILCGVVGLFGASYIVASLLMKEGKNEIGFVHMVRDFQNMPVTMRQLAIVQFFTWFALFSMWIYTTPAVTSHIYHATDPKSAEYSEGADWVGILFGIYNGVAAVTAWLLPLLARSVGRRMTHLIALALGGVGLISIYFIQDPMLLILSMVGVGIAWASILSMPYAILSSSLPAGKMGYYMGIFNFFIVIPQIVAASILGFIVHHFFDGHSIYAFLVGGISMILSGILTLRVYDKDDAIRQSS